VFCAWIVNQAQTVVEDTTAIPRTSTKVFLLTKKIQALAKDMFYPTKKRHNCCDFNSYSDIFNNRAVVFPLYEEERCSDYHVHGDELETFEPV
jgi:hypothetical protein